MAAAAPGAAADGPSPVQDLNVCRCPLAAPRSRAEPHWGRARGIAQVALLHAALQRQAEPIQRLLQQGADVNTVDGRGRTPLWRASEKGNTEVVRTLLDAHADQRADNEDCTPAWVAAANGNTHILDLLFAVGASHQPKPNGASPLWAAARFGHAAAVDALVQHGATHEVAHAFGTTPLEAALLHGNPVCLPPLVAGGALRAVSAAHGERAASRAAYRTASVWLSSTRRDPGARRGDAAAVALGVAPWPSALKAVLGACPEPDVVDFVVRDARDRGATVDLDAAEEVEGGAAMSDDTLVEAARSGFLSSRALVRAVACGRRSAHTVGRVLRGISASRYDQLVEAAADGPIELQFVLRPSRELARQVAPTCTPCSLIALHHGLLPARDATALALTLFSLPLSHRALHGIATCLRHVDSGFPECT